MLPSPSNFELEKLMMLLTKNNDFFIVQCEQQLQKKKSNKIHKKNKSNEYLDIVHICVTKLFSEMFVLLEKIDDLSEVVVIVKSRILHGNNPTIVKH